MRIETRNGKKWISLSPGDCYASRDDVVITTLLGSCVSVCLYDPVNMVAGMNHFLLSNDRHPKETPLLISEAGRYGVHSMEILINQLLGLGAQKKFLKAKAFGGGKILGLSNEDRDFLAVGQVNVLFVLEFLNNESIPLVSSSLGGNRGRVIHFHTDDYRVMARRIGQTLLDKTYGKELYFWRREIRKKREEEKSFELWNQGK